MANVAQNSNFLSKKSIQSKRFNVTNLILHRHFYFIQEIILKRFLKLFGFTIKYHHRILLNCLLWLRKQYPAKDMIKEQRTRLLLTAVVISLFYSQFPHCARWKTLCN